MKHNKKIIKEAIDNFIQQLYMLLESNVVEDQLHDYFGDKIYSSDYNYKINNDDLQKMQIILSNNLFDKALELIPVDIVSKEYAMKTSDNEFKGRIGYDVVKTANGYYTVKPYRIEIVDYFGKDNLAKIISVMSHELIHQYDYVYGPASVIIPMQKSMHDLNISAKDKTDDYDYHGNFFSSHMNRINNDYDLGVQISYDMKDNSFMKTKKSKPITVYDKTTSLSENDNDGNDLWQIAEMLSHKIVNDGSCTIEVHDDNVRIWVA